MKIATRCLLLIFNDVFQHSMSSSLDFKHDRPFQHCIGEYVRIKRYAIPCSRDLGLICVCMVGFNKELTLADIGYCDIDMTSSSECLNSATPESSLWCRVFESRWGHHSEDDPLCLDCLLHFVRLDSRPGRTAGVGFAIVSRQAHVETTKGVPQSGYALIINHPILLSETFRLLSVPSKSNWRRTRYGLRASA